MLQLSPIDPQPAWRGGRSTPPGTVHRVDFATADLRPHFADFAAAATAAKGLHALQRTNPSRLLAWVLMPERWHGLIELAPGDSLSHCVARMKRAMARALLDADPMRTRVWALDFNQRPLVHDREVLDCAGKLVLAPVRAGLVHRLIDYPFWDAVWLPPVKRAPVVASADVGDGGHAAGHGDAPVANACPPGHGVTATTAASQAEAPAWA
jgi:putative transposase